MFAAWVVFHVIVCVALVVVVLMQSSKGEGLAGSAFGGGGGVGQAVFGGRGAASFLSKATTVLAIVFMVNCGVLAFMSAGVRPGSQASSTEGSAVTRQAQQELEAQRARQAQQQLADTTQQQDTSGNLLDNLMNQESEQPTDTTGGK